MPFAHGYYRWIKTTNYDYRRRRCCFIAVCITYSVIFAVLGAVFLGLYIDKVNYLDSYNCSICSSYGATQSCGFQLCCFPNDWVFSYSYQQCLGDYGEGIYFILFIVFFCYAGYELFLTICTLCNGSGLQNTDIIVIDQNPQYVGLNNYGYQQNYQQNYTNY